MSKPRTPTYCVFACSGDRLTSREQVSESEYLACVVGALNFLLTNYLAPQVPMSRASACLCIYDSFVYKFSGVLCVMLFTIRVQVRVQ